VTPDLYDAWHTAGDWVLTYWPWLAAAGGVLAAVVAVACAVSGDYRSHNDRRAAWLTVCQAPRPEPAQPGTDPDLLLDCIAAYGNCDELNRLLDDIRKENQT